MTEMIQPNRVGMWQGGFVDEQARGARESWERRAETRAPCRGEASVRPMAALPWSGRTRSPQSRGS